MGVFSFSTIRMTKSCCYPAAMGRMRYGLYPQIPYLTAPASVWRGDLNVKEVSVGGIYLPQDGGDPINIPVDLSLNGGRHSLTNLTVNVSSHITITGGLRVNNIYILGTLTASGPFFGRM